ncbi:unnamed protein product [Lactuca virosa]|uniref:Uncharacterized protein n=1 Tax=Lactuca virosa TaxID=75947 RepID=A0AAU9NTJ0_9ASTR|nr:unnamed protein product [Lactuca virosa]
MSKRRQSIKSGKTNFNDPFSKSESSSSFIFHSAATKEADNDNGLNSTARNSAWFIGYHGSDDEGGWEFLDAYSESKLAQNGKDNKERSAP